MRALSKKLDVPFEVMLGVLSHMGFVSKGKRFVKFETKIRPINRRAFDKLDYQDDPVVLEHLKKTRPDLPEWFLLQKMEELSPGILIIRERLKDYLPSSTDYKKIPLPQNKWRIDEKGVITYEGEMSR